MALNSEGGATETEIQEWVKGKVAKHKYLTGGVVFVDEVPKSAAGKIQRKVLREWARRGSDDGEGDGGRRQQVGRSKL